MEQCSICFNPMTLENICTTNCNHSFCKSCLDNWFNRNNRTCPMCRTNIEYFNHNNNIIRIIFNSLNVFNETQQNNMINNINANIVRNYNLLKKYLLVSWIIIPCQLYTIISSENEYDNCYDNLQICYSNISKIFDDFTTCNDNINNIEYIDVISPFTNTVLSCGFPFYYVNKCLE